MRTFRKLSMVIMAISGALLFSCGGPTTVNDNSASSENTQSGKNEDPNDPMANKGIGPVKSITLGAFDEKMAVEGQEIYQKMCSACHKPEEKSIGPAPKGIMERRSPEWIMNMILNPEEMTQKDPVARQLLIDYNLAPMANQHLTQEEARKILEYFRTL